MQTAAQHLAKAKQHIASGEQHYEKAVAEILAAKQADPYLSRRAIARALGRDEKWVRTLLVWAAAPSQSEPPPHVQTQDEIDAKIITGAAFRVRRVRHAWQDAAEYIRANEPRASDEARNTLREMVAAEELKAAAIVAGIRGEGWDAVLARILGSG